MEAPPSPFVISTGAQRSGEICGVSGPPLGTFFDRAQGDAKRHQFSRYCQWKRRPPPLSSRPERSVVERSAVSAVLPWERFSTERRVMQNDTSSAATVNGSAALPLCHLDRSAA